MKHGLIEPQKRGFYTLYLSTELNYFYKKKDVAIIQKDKKCS
jgi:hypothetical protein